MRRDERTRPERLQLSFACSPHVWINLYCDGLARPRFTPHQIPTRKKSHCYLPKLESSSPGRSESVNQGHRALCVNLQIRLTQPRQLHLWRIFVFDSQRNRVGSGVLNIDVNVRLGAHSKSSAELASDADSLGKFAATSIDYRQD